VGPVSTVAVGAVVADSLWMAPEGVVVGTSILVAVASEAVVGVDVNKTTGDAGVVVIMSPRFTRLEVGWTFSPASL
jgi:hypothetical protein